MKVHCPYCGVAGSADSSYSGRKVKCPKCSAIFELIPGSSLQLSDDHPSVGFSSPVKVHCPHCGVLGTADGSYDGRRVKCPECSTIFTFSADMGDTASEKSPSMVPPPLRAQEVHTTGEHAAAVPAEDVETTVAFDEAAGSELPESDGPGGRYRPGTAANTIAAYKIPGYASSAGKPKFTGAATDKPFEGRGPGDRYRPETAVNTIAAYKIPGYASSAGKPKFAGAATGKPFEGRGPGDRYRLETAVNTIVAYKIPGYAASAGKLDKQEPAAVAGEEEFPHAGVEAAGEVPVATEMNKAEDIPETGEAVLVSVEAEPLAVEESGMDREPAAEQAGPVEQEPYGVDAEQCWQCGRKDNSGHPFTTKAGRMYCSDCLVVEEEPETASAGASAGIAGQPWEQGAGVAEGSPGLANYDFSIGEALREAWEKTKGAKATIWKGSAVMYLAILVVVALGAFFLPPEIPENQDASGTIASTVFQLVTDALSVLFTAGLLYMGIRRVSGDPIEWRMVYRGFSCAGKVIVASILQTLLVSVGILLLILPGIYLAVGYAMALPLIVDRGMSPWEAMETSRKAIHKIWWKAAGLLFVMGVILLVSMIPMGIGLIWTWPMFIVLAGVVYRYLFGSEEKAE